MDKKGLSAIVATVLLVMLVVVAFISLQNWFTTFSSDITAQESNNQQGGAEILEMKDSILYVKNNYDDFNVSSVIINDQECTNVSGIYNESIVALNLSSCSITGSFGEITIKSPQGFVDKTVSFDTLKQSISYFSSVWNLPADQDPTVTLPLVESGTYNFTVDWGDGTNDTITQWNQSEISHIYPYRYNWTVNITGTIEGWSFNNGGDRQKIIEIRNWGPLRLGNDGSYFYGASNLEITATDILDLTGTTNMEYAFSGTDSLQSIPNIELWNFENINSTDYMFYLTTSFDQSLSDLDVSSVTSMVGMFENSNFNGSLANWDTSSVINMSYMFYQNSVFDRDLSSWDTSSVTDLKRIFSGTAAFNGDISTWNISSVLTLEDSFSDSVAFNQDLDQWDTSSVTNMRGTFWNTSAFNGNISTWDTSSVTNFFFIFAHSSNFNNLVNNWDVSSATTMSGMFFNTIFNQDLRCWNVSAIGSEPPNFAASSPLFEGNNPVWGTDGTDCSNFISTWNTSHLGTSSSNQIILPLLSSGTYNFTVDWGDGTNDTITQWNQSEVTHTYSSSGVYNVSITGDIDGWSFNNGGDVQKIVEISRWGPLRLGDSGGHFYGAGNLNITAADILNTSGMTNMSYMFENANDLTTVPNMNLWDTSSVTTMFHMFRGANDFNQPVNDWNTSSVTNMRDLFMVTNFNQLLDNWDVSNVEDMGWMFVSSPFNQSIGNWDTSSVTDMENMFGSSDFNRNISCWNVTNIGSDPGGFSGVDEDNEPIWGTDGTSC